MLSNIQSHYRDVTQETPKNPETFESHIFTFFEPVSAALLLQETTVTAPV